MADPSAPPSPAPAAAAAKAAPLLHPHQQYVDHAYTDYAAVPDDDLVLLREAGDAKGAPTGASLDEARRLSGRGGAEWEHAKARGAARDPSRYSPVALPFPGKLLEVLDRGDLRDIVDWMPHGRAFLVKRPKPFTEDVLPRFFKQTKFLSFTRQLNLWGFKRITRGTDAGAYYHELFLPGRPNLAMRMKRLKIKGTGTRAIPNPEGEPNFYRDYPRVARVVRDPGPLPPLPHERIAMVMNRHQGATPGGVGPGATLLQVSPGLQGEALRAGPPPGPPQASNLEALRAGQLLGLPPPSNAAAAESRLRGSVQPSGAAAAGLLMLSGKAHAPAPSAPRATAVDAELAAYLRQRASTATTAAALERELATTLRLRQRAQAAAAAVSASAPRTFDPLPPAAAAARNAEDEVSAANRRLLERLLEQPGAPLSAVQGGALFRRGSDGSLAVPPPTLADRRPSLTAASGLSSLLGRRPLPAAPPPATLLSALEASRLPPRLASALAPGPRSATLPGLGAAAAAPRVRALTDALREARQLEEMASRQRAAASALATALLGYEA